MNAGTQTARNAPLSFVAANEAQAKNAEFLDFQDLCSRVMDQALGIEKAALSTAVSLNSCALDIYQDALWFTPVFGTLFDTVFQALTSMEELQMYWFTLLAPQHVATPSSAVAGNSGTKAQPSADVLAHSMDIAIGERFTAPGSTVTSISGGQTQPKPKADVLERSMDIAIGTQKAA